MLVMYSLGVIVFGGFVLFIVMWLLGVIGNLMVLVWYLLVSSVISLGVFMLFLMYFGCD